MPSRVMRRRGFLLIETLIALLAASVFLAAALSMFSACAGLLSSARGQLDSAMTASAAISAILSGEDAENAAAGETVYAGSGLAMRRVTLKNRRGGEDVVIVLPERNFR